MVKKEKEKEKANSAENIKVIVRCRPLNDREKASGYKSCVDLNLADATVQVNHVVGEPDRWTFDAVVNNTYAQRDVFTQFIMPLIDSVLDGFNATVFAYGQSGSGKTHTMTGKLDDEDLKGIIPRTFEYVFSHIREQQRTNSGRTYNLSCTFVELYNGKIHDLLAKQQVALAVKENKDKTFFVQGVYAPQVKFPEDLVRHMEEGTERRKVASTDLNADSSRSHSLFTLTVDMLETDDEGNTRSVTSKFNLVDLAGSERQSKTGAAGDTLKEGCNINLSLSALGTVIDTLVKGKGHVPFRSSPLTMLLKDSLGGSSKTVMFANIGPSEHNLSETVSTLRFADRAKQIKNKPVVNMDSKDQKIQELTEQVNELREKLKQFESVGLQSMEEELEQLRQRVGELEVDLDNAVKGREADLLEATSKIEHQAAEHADDITKIDELTGALDRVKVENNCLVEQLRDEKAQRDEIWAACSAHFGEDVSSVDALLDRIRVLANSVPVEEHVRLSSELRSAVAASEAAREANVAETAGLRTELASVQEELSSVQKKLEKTKEKLEREKDARKTMIADSAMDVSAQRMSSETSLSPQQSSWIAQKHDLEKEHAAVVQGLKAEIDALNSRADSREDVENARAEGSRLVAEKESVIAEMQKRLDLLSATISNPSPNDEPAVMHLKRLLAQQEEALRNLRQQLAEFESNKASVKQRTKNLRGKSRAEATAAESDNSIVVPKNTLLAELQVTAEHRDDLLRHVLDGTSTEVTAEVSRFAEENVRLRNECLRLAGLSDLLEATNSRVAQLEHENNMLETSARDSHRLPALEAELEKAREINEQLRVSYSEKEALFVAQLTTGEDADSPLARALEMLQIENASLSAEIVRLQKELRALQSHLASQASTAEVSELQQEIHRLQDAISAPRAEDTEVTAQLRNELHHREQAISKLEEDLLVARSPAKSEAQGRVSDDVVRLLQETQSKNQMLELEIAESLETLEAVKTEAAEALEKRDLAKKELAALTTEFNTRGKELSDVKLHVVELENKIAELNAEIDRIAKETANSSSTIESLNARLKERTDQTAELRKSIEQVKELAEAHKQRSEQLKQNLQEKQRELADKDLAFVRAKEEQELAFQRMMNRRIDALTEEHKKALSRKDDDIAAVRRKTKKIEDKLEKLKEKYDSKVYEYEELVSRMEEQKFEAMRNLRDRDVVVIEEGQEMVQDALKKAKEQQRLRADRFANGEVDSMVATFRPAGSAAVAARARATGGGTPPSEDITTGRKSPRPAGYTVGRAVMSSEAPAGRGGAGYTGYVPEPPPKAASNRPFNGGLETVPDSYLDANGGGGDIYDF